MKFILKNLGAEGIEIEFPEDKSNTEIYSGESYVHLTSREVINAAEKLKYDSTTHYRSKVPRKNIEYVEQEIRNVDKWDRIFSKILYKKKFDNIDPANQLYHLVGWVAQILDENGYNADKLFLKKEVRGES